MSAPSFSDSSKMLMYPAVGIVASTDIAWVDMAGYSQFVIAVGIAAAGGGGISEFKIVGATGAGGTGTTKVLATHPLAASVNTAGDFIFLEISDDDQAVGGTFYRYVSCRINQHPGQFSCIAYIRGIPAVSESGLTVDVLP